MNGSFESNQYSLLGLYVIRVIFHCTCRSLLLHEYVSYHFDCLIHSLYQYWSSIYMIFAHTRMLSRLIESINIFFPLFWPLFFVLGTDFDRNEVKYAKLCFVVLFHTYLLSIKLLTSIASLSLIESENDENWLFQLFMVNWTCTGVALVLHPVAPDRPAELIHSYHTKGL